MNSNVQLEELADGALAEKFQQVLAKVVDNLRDVNTSYKTKRKITIQLDFIQDESREDVRCDVAVSCKLAQPKPMSEFIFRMKDKDYGVSCAVIEADGGAWINAATKNIKEYLEFELSEFKNILIIS